MAGRRVETERLRELVRLHRMERSGRDLARLLRMGPNTVRRYRGVLARAGLLVGSATELPSLEEVRRVVDVALGPRDGWRPPAAFEVRRSEIVALLDKGLGPRAVFDRLRLAAGGRPLASYSSMKRFVRRIRRERGEHAAEVAIPVESSTGELAQVDFGYAGRLYDPAKGVLRRAWVFCMVLCHSRLTFVKLVFDQRVETWLRLHEEAFAFFGGSVGTVVPDNTRRAVLRAAFGVDGPTELNRSYRELAQHYGFLIDPAPPGAPRKKGKVEAAVKYALSNGLAGRDGESIDDAQAALARWNREIANTRVHGSTRRRPIDVFEQEERVALRPLPATPCELAVWKRARVHTDVHVAFERRLFSVPWTLVHEEVWVRAGRTVQVFHDDRLVATHERHGPRRTTLDEHLPPDRRDLRHRGRAFWEVRAARVGPETAALVRQVFDSDAVLSRLRQVQAVVRYLERYPRGRAEAAARRVRLVGECSYGHVKRVLTLGLDLQPTSAVRA